MSKGAKLGVVFVGVLGAFVTGSAIHEFWPGKQAAGVGIAISVPALVALFGMFWIAEKWKDAITAAIVVPYLIVIAGAFALFVFPQADFKLADGAKIVFDEFTGLMKVVLVSYFGQEAVRALAQAYSNGAAKTSSTPTVIDS
jgi:hypothetical protein